MDEVTMYVAHRIPRRMAVWIPQQTTSETACRTKDEGLPETMLRTTSQTKDERLCQTMPGTTRGVGVSVWPD